MVYMIRSEA